jgi:hypothetical protein
MSKVSTARVELINIAIENIQHAEDVRISAIAGK